MNQKATKLKKRRVRQKLCGMCSGTGTRRYSVPDGNPYSKNYELKQDYRIEYETCRNCGGTGKVK